MMLQIILDELVEATIRLRYESAGRTRVRMGREYPDQGPARRPPGDQPDWCSRREFSVR